MQMRASIQIKSALKALNDVVLPALDPNNKPAQEQIRLVIGMLTLLSQQLPLQFRFDCDELARLIAMANELQDGAKAGAGTTAALATLAERTKAAASTLERARATPEDVTQRVRELRKASGELVTQAYREGDAGCRDRVGKTVLAASREQLLRDRALLLMQGWEPDPKAIPSISSLLGEAQS